jgi:transcriptional regulator with XRE-family HTH domain
MADWTFGLEKLTGSGRGGAEKAAEAWVRAWSTRFREWWQSTNLSQSELAKRLGVSPMTVSRWTRGKARPTNEAASRLEKMISSGTAATARPKAAEPSVTDRLTAALEGLPHGKRIAHLFESLGRTIEQAIASVTTAAPQAIAPATPKAEAAAPARAGRAASANKRQRGAAAEAPARAGAPTGRRGRRPSAKPAAAATREAETRSGTARGKRPGRRPGRPAKSAGAKWPEVIKAVQQAEGWGEGRNRRLADVLRVAPSTISNWLGGHRTPRGEPRDKLTDLARKHGIATPA